MMNLPYFDLTDKVALITGGATDIVVGNSGRLG